MDLARAISLREAALMIRGKRGRAPTLHSVRIWCKTGWGPAKIKLQARKLNGEWLTLPEWVEEFEQARLGISAAAG